MFINITQFLLFFRKINTTMWLRQLKVILWKNFIIRKRHWFLFLCEASIPVLLFLLMAYLRSELKGLKKKMVPVTYNHKNPISYEFSGFNWEKAKIYYSPSYKYYDDIIHRIQEKFQIDNNSKYIHQPKTILYIILQKKVIHKKFKTL